MNRSLNTFSSEEKQIFVMNGAWKPINSLHGEEVMMVSLGELMLALVSLVADSGDTIKSIQTGDTNIVFLVKSLHMSESSAWLQTEQLTFLCLLLTVIVILITLLITRMPSI